MKNPFVLFAVLLALPLGMSAGKGPIQPSATLNLSPYIWVSGDTINVTGVSYRARKPVTVEVVGPVSLTVTTLASSSGNLAASLPYTEFTPGTYTVSAFQTQGGTLTLMATSGFEAQ
jgi:hypothetical protein